MWKLTYLKINVLKSSVDAQPMNMIFDIVDGL